MRGLIYGLGAVVALAIAAPAFAGDLTSIEVDPSGKDCGQEGAWKARADTGHWRHTEQGFQLWGTLPSAT